jgi:Fe2+ or Zn2+ uptake regulation protein
MGESQSFTQQFHDRGFRLTPQRLVILQVLSDSNEHLTPSQVYERVRKMMPGVTEATIYRTLEFLARNDLAFAAHVGNGRYVYEIAGNDHHHVVCRACGRERKIDHAMLYKLYKQLETQTGYQLTTSHLTFFGLCPDCQKK